MRDKRSDVAVPIRNDGWHWGKRCMKGDGYVGIELDRTYVFPNNHIGEYQEKIGEVTSRLMRIAKPLVILEDFLAKSHLSGSPVEASGGDILADCISPP